jgi:hypothetical protein
VPETGSYSTEEWDPSGYPSEYTVVVPGASYEFIPSDGVIKGPQNVGPGLNGTFGSSLKEGIPADAKWFKRGDSYKTEFEYTMTGDGAATTVTTVTLTYEAEQDPATGMLVWEKLSIGDGYEEVKREIVPPAEVRAPAPDDVYQYAAKSWAKEVETLRRLPYETVGLDLPGLVLSRIEASVFDPSSERAVLDYSLPSLPHPHAVQIELFPYGPDTAGLAFDERYDEGSTVIAFKRGDALVRIGIIDGTTVGLPTNPFAGMDLSLKKVIAALVPIAQLPDEHFALPASYTPAGTTVAQ